MILIGLTGSGKSTVAKIIEISGVGKRVKRQTTRSLRNDDDLSLIQKVKVIDNGKMDFVIQGWGNDLYCISNKEIEVVQAEKKIPVIELGSYYDAEKLKEIYKHAKIILIEREIKTKDIEEICKQRGMDLHDINERVKSFYEDENELIENRKNIDYIFFNNKNINDLTIDVIKLVSEIRWDKDGYY